MAKRKQKGKVVRLGYNVHEALRRRKTKGESWDAFFRRLMGLPTRKGEVQDKKTYWLLESARLIFDTEKEARGHAILDAVRDGRGARKVEAPIKVSEDI